jgi:hypothetical protein
MLTGGFVFPVTNTPDFFAALNQLLKPFFQAASPWPDATFRAGNELRPTERGSDG